MINKPMRTPEVSIDDLGKQSQSTPESEIEIEIVSDDPEGLNSDGSVDVDLDKSRKKQSIELGNIAFDADLSVILDEVDPNYLTLLASDLEHDYDTDLNTRADWERTYIEGIKLLGLKYEERSEPWEGACGTFSPILTEAVVRFQSETIMETFPASGPVKTHIIGKQTRPKEEAAKRVENDMNYELLHVMTEYRPEHEKMLWNLPIAGSAFKKVYYDPNLGRQTSIFVPAEDIILPYGVSEIFTAQRLTHRMRKTKNEILRLQSAGFYRDINIGDPLKMQEDIQERKDRETGFTASYDDRYTILEMHVELEVKGYEDKDIDGEITGVQYPYVVSILKDNGKILSIRRNWKEEDDLKLKRQHFVHYQYVPGFGSYGFGLMHLIGGAARSATSIVRQLVDAGTLSNLPGGLKTRGLRIKGDDTPVSPGEWRDVDVPSGAIRDNVMALPYKEPSQTLIVLLQSIVEEARRVGSTADMKISDMSASAPVGTTLALLERQLKVMSAVQARTHYSMRQELKLLAGIIRDYTDDEYDYDTEAEDGPHAKKADYEYTDILPVSDPNAATLAQRVVQYQAALQMAQMAPEIYDQPRLHRQMLDVIGIPNASKLVKLPEDLKPQDPITENMAILKSVPVKAFAYQDHEAHILTHQTFMQDPKIMAAIGQNPKAQGMMASLQAHLAEHAAFSYRAQIEQQLGIPLPELDEEETSPISPEDEKELASLIAQAAQRTLTMNQAQQAQQEAQAAAQNPELALQQKELALKEAEGLRKGQNDSFDYNVAMERIKLEREKLMNDKQAKDSKLVVDKLNKDADRNLKQRLEVLKVVAKPKPIQKPFNKE